jgi:hypothetical protein
MSFNLANTIVRSDNDMCKITGVLFTSYSGMFRESWDINLELSSKKT